MSQCQSDCRGNGRLEGIQNILDGKFSICQGLCELCEALKDLRCCRDYEAQINVVNGIHHIKEGLKELREGLRSLRGRIGCREKKLIKEGIRDICRALDILCEVLRDICCGCRQEAEEKLVKAICCIKKGLSKIENGLEDIYLCS